RYHAEKTASGSAAPSAETDATTSDSLRLRGRFPSRLGDGASRGSPGHCGPRALSYREGTASRATRIFAGFHYETSRDLGSSQSQLLTYSQSVTIKQAAEKLSVSSGAEAPAARSVSRS